MRIADISANSARLRNMLLCSGKWLQLPGSHGRPALAGLLGLLLALGSLALAGCGGQASAFAADALVESADADSLSLMERIELDVENHSDAEGPFFAGNFAQKRMQTASELVVVSYNLRYGEAVDEAIAAFRQNDPLPAAGIVLLQEMDEASVSTIARELEYNYVYYPASVAEDGDNFGNAILSRWPISNPGKLILPGLHPITGQQRTATRATVRVGETDVLVYSTHIEVATAPPSLREAQFAAILDDIPDNATHAIVGGDFNTVTGWGVAALATQFAGANFQHDSAQVGPTFTRFGVRPSATDHIFSRGFTAVDAGVLGDISASDHFPVWTRYTLP